MPFINRSPLNYPANSESSIRIFKTDRAPTNNDFASFKQGDEWWDTSSDDFYKMVFKNRTSGLWRKMAGTASSIETFTTDDGNKTGPDGANNIDLQGNILPNKNGMYFSSDPANYSISAKDLRNITKYVVDPTLNETEYQTIQSALDAANTAGGNATVYVRNGTYTENLTLYDDVFLKGEIGPLGISAGTRIVGTHTPPATGAFTIEGITLVSTTDIFNSAVAGSANIFINNSIFEITNGFIFNLPNWTGLFDINDCGENSTNNGIANNTAGADFFTNNSQIGAGTGKTFVANGDVRFDLTFLDCPCIFTGSGVFSGNFIITGSTMSIGGSKTGTLGMGSLIFNTITFADTSTISVTDTTFSTGANASITHNSANDLIISNCSIDTSNNPAIDGTGTLTLGSTSFLDNKEIANTITLRSKEIRGGGFRSRYVVSLTGETPYITIQSALDAANANGGNANIILKPGAYTEDLTLYDTITLEGDRGSLCSITGTHTPPNSGNIELHNLTLISAADILNSAFAGTTNIEISDSFIQITNGYVFNLLNWTGTLLFDDCKEASTNDGVVNNSGGSTIKFLNSEMGAGSGKTMTLTGNGNLRFNTCNINCPINIAGTGTLVFQQGVKCANTVTIGGAKIATLTMGNRFENTLTISGTATTDISNSIFDTGSNIAITQNSSNSLVLSNVTINSSAAPDVITGTGTVEFGSVSYPSSAGINATIVKQDVTQIESGRTHVGSGVTNNTYYYEAVEANVGGNVRGRFYNTDSTNVNSHASFFFVTTGSGGGDPYTRYQINGGGQFSFGIDNSDSDTLKITDGPNPSSGNELWSVTLGGAVTFNKAFTFPFTDGTPNQILKTDGAGTLAWANDSIGTGRVIQVVSAQIGTLIAVNAAIPQDSTIPQQTEGVEVITLTITPTSVTNKLYIFFSTNGRRDAGAGTNAINSALFQDATLDALTASDNLSLNNTWVGSFSLDHFMTAGTIAPTTFKARVGSSGGFVFDVNFDTYGGLSNTRLTIWEIKA